MELDDDTTIEHIYEGHCPKCAAYRMALLRIEGDPPSRITVRCPEDHFVRYEVGNKNRNEMTLSWRGPIKRAELVGKRGRR